MEIKSYIFLTVEGITFQPDSESSEPDIENLQVIGFAKGKDSKEAFHNLITENKHLLKTTFDEIFCYELTNNYEKSIVYYHLGDLR